MDFSFSEEQEMLRGQARALLEAQLSPERVAELSEAGEHDSGLWRKFAELGWTGLSVPEDKGGAGFGFLEEAVLFEELGRALYPGPFFSTVALALPALAGHDAVSPVAQGERTATLAWAEPGGPYSLADLDAIGTKAEGRNGECSLSGEKTLVPDLSFADDVIVVARAGDGVGLWLLEEGAGRRRSLDTVDRSRALGNLTLDGAKARVLVEGAEATSLLSLVRLRALAALSLEAVGVAQRAVDLAIEHANSRQQFDKPIGAYQAVAHQIADSYVELELARSLAYWAAWCVAENDAQVDVAVAAAKSFTAEAAVAACERSIQVHGGIGFTWEHVLHRLYKRAQWIAHFEDFGARERGTIASFLLDA